ncbi:MAG: SDR family oxidoreductase [Betaproteobacteria bacterium]|nr:SDR family oxidoreductase [Betaproteobacteria bacterium]
MQNKVVLITGANTGIGFFTALELARQGAHIVMACRTEARANAARDQIRLATGNRRVETVAVDLGDFQSIRACADQLLARDLPIHCLINNAGIAGARGITDSGFELATNHMGHFALTQALLPRIKESAPARIVTVASRAHRYVSRLRFEDLTVRTRSWLTIQEYAVSKLANILFSQELGRRLQGSGVHTYALHPGVIASEIWRHAPQFIVKLRKRSMITPEEGAQTTLYCASADALTEQTGLYYDQCQVRQPSALASDQKLAEELWRYSERALPK